MKAFLDSYALMELLTGNEIYRPYLRGGVTSLLNLLEFHVHACRVRGEADADVAFQRLRAKAIPIENEDVLAASRFRRDPGHKGASYIDALGYAMAQRRRIPFVTEDRLFRGMPGVVP